MVRLKEYYFTNLTMEKRISIPYGAIKSVCNLIYVEQLQKFQFLMVRLKDK